MTVTTCHVFPPPAHDKVLFDCDECGGRWMWNAVRRFWKRVN
jgi:hypothetical protein